MRSLLDFHNVGREKGPIILLKAATVYIQLEETPCLSVSFLQNLGSGR